MICLSLICVSLIYLSRIWFSATGFRTAAVLRVAGSDASGTSEPLKVARLPPGKRCGGGPGRRTGSPACSPVQSPASENRTARNRRALSSFLTERKAKRSGSDFLIVFGRCIANRPFRGSRFPSPQCAPALWGARGCLTIGSDRRHKARHPTLLYTLSCNVLTFIPLERKEKFNRSASG